MPDTSTLAAKYPAEAAHVRHTVRVRAAERERWPFAWTLALAIGMSLGLWALIFMGVRALWTMFA